MRLSDLRWPGRFTTAWSRSNHSYSSLIVVMATALAPESRSGRAWYSDTQTAVEIVGERFYARLIKNIQSDVLAEFSQAGNAVAGEIVHQVGPVFKGGVVSEAGLERHGLVAGLAREFAAGDVLAGLAKLHHFGGPLQRAHFGQAGDILAVPLHLKAKVAIRIKPIGLRSHACH